jgi:hypothetical protein
VDRLLERFDFVSHGRKLRQGEVSVNSRLCPVCNLSAVR